MEVHVWTDGAVSGNGGPGRIGSAAILQLLNDGQIVQEKEYSWGEELERATNNIAELKAIVMGIEQIKPELRTTTDLVIYTDSEWCINGIAGNWRITHHLELIQQVRRSLAAFASWEFRHVRGHSGVPLNERCDVLASQQAQSGKFKPKASR